MVYPSGADSAESYLGFISYSTRYAEWVKRLHANLELCLGHHGEKRRLFLDQIDIATGRSWVVQLQKALDASQQLILVVTPEAMASRRVQDEWDSLIAGRPNWKQGLQLVKLIDAPLPPFFQSTQWADFTDHDEAQYRDALQRLLSGLLRLRNPRARPELDSAIEIPPPPSGAVPSDLRQRAVRWVEQQLPRRPMRIAVQSSLGLDEGSLDDHPSCECAASAALVYAAGDDDPITGLRRCVSRLLGGFEGEEGVGELVSLKSALDELAESHSETGLLRVWLDKVQRDNATLLPTFGKNQELTLLDRVFVQLALRPDRIERSLEGKAKDGLDFQQPLELPELLELDPAEHAWVTRRWVVRGDPGSGKTTLVRYLARSLAHEPRPRWIPVFESLPRLMADEGVLLFERFEKQLRRAGQPAVGLARALEQLADEGKLLLLLDGLDELSLPQRTECLELLRSFSDRWAKTPIVVTTRPIGYQRPGIEFQEVDLLPLDRSRQRELLARWLGRRSGRPDTAEADRLLAALQSETSLQALAASPLYLTLMALLHEDDKPIQQNRPKLYDDVFNLLMEGKHRYRAEDRRPIDFLQGVRQVLRHLGFEMTRDNLDAEPVDQLEARLYQPEFDGYRETLERVPRWRRSLRPFLEDLSERTGILGPHDGPEAAWRFWHRTFREALAAEELAARYRSEGREVVLEHARDISGKESSWAEPYALLTGQVDEPDELVKALVKENQALGLRALATAQTLADETIVHVLELSDAPDERAKVYLRLPELVGDPQRTLELIDQLRRQTRNGDDLYHLDLVCELIARQHGEHAAAARLLRDRLYAHIPPPPEGLFERISTADGEVALWCEIPEGGFLMGSPESEEGRDDDEGPQHEVVVASPFRLGAVPVTQAQYAAFDPDHKSGFPGANRPVEQVSWWAAMAFCRWLSSHAATAGARLPSETEWEYACRAGTTTRYWSGEGDGDLGRVGWYGGNSENKTHPVARKPASPWGLYDMHGNVREWCTTTWPTHYAEREQGVSIDPAAVDSTELMPTSAGSADPSADPAETRRASRVIRGGSYWNGARGDALGFSGQVRPEGPERGLGLPGAVAPRPPEIFDLRP